MIRPFQAAVRRLDSWLNLLTGVGGGLNKTAFQFRPSEDAYLDDGTLQHLYDLDGLAARIVDSTPKHALRRGFGVTTGNATVDTALRGQLDTLDVNARTRFAWTWARLFGGGALLLGLDDGRDPADPVDLNALRAVRYVVDLDRRELVPVAWDNDPSSARFGQPVHFLLQRAGAQAVDSRVIHVSRVIRFLGAETTRRRKQELRGWGDSVLSRVYGDLQQARGGYAAVSTLLQDASQGVFKMKDLLLQVASDSDDAFKRRMEMMDMARSVGRAILIDADSESFERVETGTLTGLPDILDRFVLLVSAGCEIPVSILMGQSPAGLNATGASDIRSWYDAISAERESMLRPRLEYLVRLLLRAKDGPCGGVEPAGWQVTFPSLWQPSPSEEADLRAKQATVDVQYITAGVLTPEEVATSRFRPEGWSAETSVDLGAREEPPPEGS